MNQSLLPPVNKIRANAEGPETSRDSSVLEPAQTASPPFSSWLNRAEWIVVLVVGLVAIALHIRFVTHVGALWRDEANSVQLATLPTFAQVWRFLDFDSFPILFFAVLRSWTGIFGAGNDAALRALGLITGLGVLAVLWLNSYSFGARLPVLSFALIGLNPMFIRYGDSTRAYGLGILLILLTFRSFWRLVDSSFPPRWTKVLSAGLCALLSVHCLYYNSVLLLAICTGAIAVASWARAWRTIGIILGIGLAAAISLLPYGPMMQRMHEWTFLVQYLINFAWLWKRAGEVLGSPDPATIWLWTGLFFIVLAIIIGGAFVHRWTGPVLFAGITCLIAVPAYALFLRALCYYTQPWYYITLIALVACSFDIVCGACRNRTRISATLLGLRVIVAAALVGLTALPAWRDIATRHTNVDFVANRLGSETTKSDVVVVLNWQYAVSLNRYYHGAAEVITFPPIADHRFHRYDLALRQMKTQEPLGPAFRRMEEVLRNGNNVFVIGDLPNPRPDVPPPVLSLGYHDPDGTWHSGNHDWIWPLLGAYFIQAHVLHGVQIPVPISDSPRVQHYEHLKLGVVRGWR